MEFLFNNEKLWKSYKKVIEDCNNYGNNTQETKELAKTFADKLSTIGSLKTSSVLVSIDNTTMNDDNKSNDKWERTFIVNDLNELQSLSTSIIMQMVDRCEKLLTKDCMLLSWYQIRFHKFLGNKAPQSGFIMFDIKLSSPCFINYWGQESRKILRSYSIRIDINEKEDNYEDIFK